MSKLILLIVLVQVFVQSRTLEKVDTLSNYSSYATYNPSNDHLLYFGVMTDSLNQIIGSKIAVRSMSDEGELILERDVGYPGIGWVDSVSVLIYKTFPETGKSFFDPNYEKALYICNIYTGESIELTDIPVDSTENKLSVSDGVVLCQTGYGFNQSLKMYKYDIIRGTKEELLELRGKDVDEYNYIFNRDMNTTFFVQLENGQHKLQFLKAGTIQDIYTSKFHVSNLCFNSSKTRLFFLSNDGTDYKYQEVLRSYDLETGEIKTHYTFEEGVSCLRVSPYKENSVLLSLELPSKISSTHTFEWEELEASFDIDPTRYLFKLQIN